jgi:hypothetical protein
MGVGMTSVIRGLRTQARVASVDHCRVIAIR